jgi:hypothetical protein
MALSDDELKKLTKELKLQAELQQEINSGLEGYMSAIEKIRAANKAIANNKKIEAKLEKEKYAAQQANDQRGVEIAEAKLKILKEENEVLEKNVKIIKQAVKEADKVKISFAAASASMVKGMTKLPGLIQGGFGKIKGLGLFELDKAMKKSALSMGVLSKETSGFRGGIKNAAKETTMIGVGIKELSELQSSYSEELGRSVFISEKGLVAMGEMVAATGLGAQEAAKMAGEFEVQGMSAERTAKFVEETMNDSHKMGLNATKVIKNIQGNIKMLNRYNFKAGSKGLAKMAESVTKLGVDMEFASGFADKLFNIEGAIDMSAQLQVMGGAWAKMADPFHLMYMARNDMEGLTEEIGQAAEKSVTFNRQTGEFAMASKEMHRLRIIAEQTGIAYDDLVTAGKNAAKFSMIKTQMTFSIGGGDEGKMLKEFITNKSFINRKGEATIMLDGKERLIKTLTNNDRSRLKAAMEEQATMKERAMAATTFDERLAYLVDQLKVYLLPLVESLSDPNNGLIKRIDKFVKTLNEPGGWGDQIETMAVAAGQIINTVGNLVADFVEILGPKGMLIGWAALKSATWVINGLALARGFMMGTKGFGMGSLIPGGSKMSAGSTMMNSGNFSKGLGTFLKGSLPMAAIGGAFSGFNEYGEQKEKGKSTGESVGRGLLKGVGATGGAMAGMAAGAAIGSAFGGIGAIPGALLGLALGSLGAGIGGKIADLDTYGVHDGLFGGMGTGTMLGSAFGPMGMLAGMGADFSKGRAVVQGGKITPIDNKDDLLAMKKGGAIDKSFGKESTKKVKYEFSDLNVTGEIKIVSPGNPGASEDLMKDSNFRYQIAKMVNSQLEKNINMGKNRG